MLTLQASTHDGSPSRISASTKPTTWHIYDGVLCASPCHFLCLRNWPEQVSNLGSWAQMALCFSVFFFKAKVEENQPSNFIQTVVLKPQKAQAQFESKLLLNSRYSTKLTTNSSWFLPGYAGKWLFAFQSRRRCFLSGFIRFFSSPVLSDNGSADMNKRIILCLFVRRLTLNSKREDGGAKLSLFPFDIVIQSSQSTSRKSTKFDTYLLTLDFEQRQLVYIWKTN